MNIAKKSKDNFITNKKFTKMLHYKFEQINGEIYAIFIELNMKGVPFVSLKGKTSCKMYNFGIKDMWKRSIL